MRIISFVAKPREADRHSTANGMPILPKRIFADEENLFFAGRFPRSNMRAVEINLSRHDWRGDLYLCQPAVSGQHVGGSRYLHAPLQFSNICDFHRVAPSEIS